MVGGKGSASRTADEGWADSCIERPSPRLEYEPKPVCRLRSRRNVGSSAVLRGKAQRECHKPSNGNLRRHGIDCPKLGVAAGLIAAASRRHAIKGAALAFAPLPQRERMSILIYTSCNRNCDDSSAFNGCHG